MCDALSRNGPKLPWSGDPDSKRLVRMTAFGSGQTFHRVRYVLALARGTVCRRHARRPQAEERGEFIRSAAAGVDYCTLARDAFAEREGANSGLAKPSPTVRHRKALTTLCESWKDHGQNICERLSAGGAHRNACFIGPAWGRGGDRSDALTPAVVRR